VAESPATPLTLMILIRRRQTSAILSAVSLFIASPLGGQQAPAGISVAAAVTVDTGTAAEGLRAGSASAAERGVAGRAIGGFIGGLPIGFLGTLLIQGDPGGPIGVGLGLGIIGAAWKLGKIEPPQSQSMHERGETYKRAYLESYKERLSERRRKAAILGGLAGGVTGLGLLFMILSEIDT
jgi:hypothetical protein